VSFDLPVSFVFVTPEFKKVCQTGAVVVVEDDSFLTVVAIEPFALWLNVVGVTPLLACVV